MERHESVRARLPCQYNRKIVRVKRSNNTRSKAWSEKVSAITLASVKPVSKPLSTKSNRNITDKKLQAPSSLEAAALLHIRLAGLPTPEREIELIDDRKFRYDFVWRKELISVEVNGQIWHKGGHSSGTGLERDYEKIALAQLAGYRIFSVSSRMIEDGTLVKWLKLAFYG